MASTRIEEATEDGGEFEISWSEIFWVIAALALTFQIWPMFYFKSADVIYDALDLTQWGWRSYLVANVATFVALAVVRFRQSCA